MWKETFEAEIWVFEGPTSWYFVTVPPELSQRIRRLTEGKRRNFGTQRVTVSLGNLRWNTSVFMDTKRNAFVLPLKADIRKKAKLQAGQTIKMQIEIEL